MKTTGTTKTTDSKPANREKVEIDGTTYYADMKNQELFDDEKGNIPITFLFPKKK